MTISSDDSSRFETTDDARTGPILFIGDSITDAGRRDDPEGLGAGWVRLAVAALRDRGDDRTVINRGVGGDRVAELAQRWQVDALDLRPGVMTVAIGVNDMWRRYLDDDPTDVESFEERYAVLLDEAVRASSPRLILVEPYLLPVSDDQRGYFEDLDPKREAVARLSKRFGATWVPMHEILTARAAEVGAATLADDGVHPTPAGTRVIADAWLEAFDRR